MTGADLIVRAATARSPVGSSPSDSVAVASGRIIAVGGRRTVEGLRGPETRVLDVPGGVILPGLVDSHCHLVALARASLAVRLFGAGSFEEVVRRVGERALCEPGAGFIEGVGWDQAEWTPPELPHHRELTAAVPDRPTALLRIDGHALLVNRPGLELAGIGQDTPDPAGGRVVRDARGEPTGLLLDTAMDLVLRHVPRPPREVLRRGLLTALEQAARAGLTSVHEMGVTADEITLLDELAREGRATARVVAFLYGEDPAWRGWLGPPRVGLHGGLLTVRGVKLFQDGALGSRGAALHEPYSDEPGTSGLLLHDPDDLLDRLRLADGSGYQVAVHAIGDRAVSTVLDALERLWAERGAADRRSRLEHAQVVRPSDRERAARLGVISAMQPVHAVSDARWAAARLGAERLSCAYSWGGVLRTGGRLALGSDFPVEEMDPLAGMRAAVAGADPLTQEQALQGYTVGPAFASFTEAELGTVEPGKLADLTVLDGDPFGSGRVVATVVGGRVVFDAT